MRRQWGAAESVPKAVWSDALIHMGDEQWPAHSVPLFVFTGENDRPRPSYKEEFRFTLKDERYINYCVRMRCGFMGTSIGLVYSPDRMEAGPGTEGQLITVIDSIIMPDNTVVLCAIGDLGFQVIRTWMPRGLGGVQVAFVQVDQVSAPRLSPIAETLASEPAFSFFAQLIHNAPRLREQLAGTGPFTGFVPSYHAMRDFIGDRSEEEVLQMPDLEAWLSSHFILGRVTLEAMYSGRSAQALDGTILTLTFTRWPRAGPCINDIPLEHVDIMCKNGVVHSIQGVITPAPVPARRGRR